MDNETIYIYDDDIGRVQYIDSMGNDKTIVNAARVSFGEDNDKPIDERDEKLISYLMKNKHTSPFEHCAITWKFVVPLFVRGQHHRHRVWSFNETSRRFTSKDIQFYLPKTFRTQHERDRQASNEDEIDPVIYNSFFYSSTASNEIKLHVENSMDLYNQMLEKGICREQSRMILPQNMYVEFFGTVNLHNAMHFLELRLSEHAQWEIRKVAEAMLVHLDDLFPIAMQAFRKLRINK